MNTTDEDRLREVLGALTPAAPISAGDARAVVRRGRQRRRATIAVVGAAAAVIAAVAVPSWLSRPGGDDGGAVAGVEQDRDPFTTLPCSDLPASAAGGFDPDGVRAARLCVSGADDFGFAYPTPPLDALIFGTDGWAEELAALPAADPGRCAATTVVPTPVRLLVEQADGTRALVDPNLCGNVTLGATTVDGADVAGSFLDALAAQRAALPAAEATAAASVDCASTGTLPVPVDTLAAPLVARLCPDGSAEPGTIAPEQDMDDARLAELVVAFDAGTRGRVPQRCLKGSVGWQLVTVDAYGDVLRWTPTRCGTLALVRPDRPDDSWQVPLSFSD